jgi:NAD(P)-dependent dehydrogenase (short-subunit alcohol dehydrogenase family)
MPPTLNLASKVALVTGARINLGYHTVLRLLRCGSHVIASTRYPHDAEARYLSENDSTQWKDRLRIIGADFRTAKDVFTLIHATKQCLVEWGNKTLDILVNNAAQTLTDRPEAENQNQNREQQLIGSSEGNLVIKVGYRPRLRGGMAQIDRGRSNPIDGAPDVSEDHTNQPNQPTVGHLIIPPTKSSWTQKLDEIPYEDVIAAHSVNAFVPLMLIRELLPMMTTVIQTSGSLKPSSYIVNVSSREGIPEKTPSHAAKRGKHVHTNMSKAALNMLTETEASEAWKTRRVAMNSVDPGYMSADPEWLKVVGQADMVCPLRWEDGAARVLWPIAQGERGIPIWGRFLRNFQTVDLGRL